MRALGTILIVAIALLGCGVRETPAGTAPEGGVNLAVLNEQIKSLVQRFYPNASCTLSGHQIHFECDARDFMVHEPLMNGDWQDAIKERGPNRHGVVGDVEFTSGTYEGQAALPQVIDKRYFTSHVSAPYSNRLDGHLLVEIKTPANTPDGFIDKLSDLLDNFDKRLSNGAG